MKVISFNINSVRARLHQIEHIRDNLDPDVIGLQETKVNDPEFPIEAINEIGYHVEHWGGKAHYGVAMLSKEKPIKCIKGFKDDTDEAHKRFIQCEYKFKNGTIDILNGYFPQGENIKHETKFPKKLKFYDDLHSHISSIKKKQDNIIVMGDFNVAPNPLDIGIGEQNVKRWLRDGKTSFQPQELEMWNSIKDLGFVDSWRVQNPDDGTTYSWFDYRSRMFDDNPKRGLRIDHILVSNNLESSIQDTGIDHVARAMEKPSDHCPVWVTL